MAALSNLEFEYQRQVRELFQQEGVGWMYTNQGKKLLKNLEDIEALKVSNRR